VSNYGPGGIVWSHTGVATAAEIVQCFDALDGQEILCHNWGTCPRECQARWDVTDETYINGVMMTLDFDYYMGYLIEAVDRTSSQCTYVAVVQYHGRREDGTFEHDFITWPGTHTFFGHDDGFDPVTVKQWAVSVIHGMIEGHNERAESGGGEGENA
jgi:hypothetical protein